MSLYVGSYFKKNSKCLATVDDDLTGKKQKSVRKHTKKRETYKGTFRNNLLL